MQVHELLANRRAEIISEMEKLQTELAEIDRMIAASRVPVMAGASAGETFVTGRPGAASGGQPVQPATKDEQILMAISEGCKTPAAISDFIRQRLGIPVNDASTRTHLSRMKTAHKVGHDGTGWTLPPASDGGKK
jgi:hypothetical protein